jgi:DNA-binding response OmpR family regulator
MLGTEFVLTTAGTRREALVRLEKVQPEVIVLDAPSLRFSCRRFCDTLQGACASLRYPFSPQKLINRVSWLLPDPDSEVLRKGNLTFHVKRRSVTRGDAEGIDIPVLLLYAEGQAPEWTPERHLTPKQARLLELFMRHSGEVLTREFLMKQVWDTDFVDDTRTLDVHVHWVREAIEEDTSSPQYLHTIRGVGYRFRVPPTADEAN